MNTQAWPRIVIAAAFLVAVVAGLYTALLIYDPVIKPIFDVAPPFIIALILAFLLDPLIDRFEKRGFSRGLSVCIVGVGFLVAFVLVGFLLVPKIADQATQLTSNYEEYVGQAQTQFDNILDHQKPLLKKLRLPTTAGEWTRRFSGQLQGAAQAGVSFLAGTLSSALSRALWIVIVPLSTVWLLKDFDNIRAKAIRFTPAKHRDRIVHLSSAVGGVFGQYVRGMITVALLFSLVSMLLLAVLGLHYGLIIGAVAGLFYMVPYVGLPILAIVAGIAGLVQPGASVPYALLLVGALIVQNVIFDMLVTPKVVGGSLGVHPVLSLFALALGGRMFGVVGMIIAVPVAASIQVVLGQLYPGIYEKAERSKPKIKPKTKKTQEPEST